MIVVQQLMDSGRYKEVGRVEDGEITQGEQMLLSLDDEEVWTEMDPERLAFRHDGPIFVAAIVDDAEGGVEAAERGLQDVEDVDTTPTQGAADAAQMAIDWKRETGNPNDCGTRTGWTRAGQLADRDELTEDTINRMVSFFARHESTQEPDEPKTDCSRMMWKAWGGDAGRTWAEDTQAQFETAREASAHDHHCALELSHVKNDRWLGWEDCLFELHHGVAYGEANKRLGEIYETNVPDFVKDLVIEAAMDELFSDFDALGSTDIMSLRSFFADQLKQDGWTTDKMATELRRLEPTLTPAEAERMTRTEVQAIINGAREDGYEATGMIEQEKFYWVGALDDRTTDACRWLIGGASAADNIGGAFKGTNPNEGGIPRTLPKLKELVQKAADKDPEIETEPREFTPHINCRKTYVRDV
jgi:hypothetical protein